MIKNYVVVSKFTGNKGFVTNITSNKIFVTFINDYDNGIGFSLKNFKNILIVDDDDLNEIISIMKDKRLENRKKKHKVDSNNYDELPIIEQEGYIFEGWYDSPTFEHQVYHLSKKRHKLSLNLYAKWTPIEDISDSNIKHK